MPTYNIFASISVLSMLLIWPQARLRWKQFRAPAFQKKRKYMLEAAKENDRIVKVPTVQVIGSGAGSFEDAAPHI
ncbi:MAG: hypothetical protein GY820_24750 [Gammaproteobacteria bacterium]|nr:hypothetical protein [Gammaproteobacteria bacterium]